MPSPSEKLAALVKLALSTDRIEEARTTALIALKLAAKEGLAIQFPIEGARSPSPSRPPPPSKSPKASRKKSWKKPREADSRGSYEGVRAPRGTEFTVKFSVDVGECAACGGEWAPGELIAWRPGERGPMHAACASQRR